MRRLAEVYNQNGVNPVFVLCDEIMRQNKRLPARILSRLLRFHASTKIFA